MVESGTYCSARQSSQVAKHRLADKVGGVKQFSRTTCLNAKCRSRFDDELALHPSIMPAAMHAAAERISTGRLRYKFHRLRLSFLDFRALLRRREHQTGISFRVDTVGHFADLESMGVVDCADLELNPCALLDSNGRRGKLVFLCRYVDGLSTFRNWTSIGCFGRRAADRMSVAAVKSEMGRRDFIAILQEDFEVADLHRQLTERQKCKCQKVVSTFLNSAEVSFSCFLSGNGNA
jgi:hypothetical protein